MKIVAVGGSGQHAALAMARLAWIGAFPKVSATIIDADRNSVMSKQLMLMGPPVLSGSHTIRGPVDLSGAAQTTFAGYMLEGAVEAQQKEVFELLFGAAQATVPISMGMFGNPAVGGTVFAATEDLHIEAANDEPVVVVGSFVGGTGSGIMHELIRAISPAARRFGVFYLPWFSPKDTGGGQGHSVGRESQHRNMLHGLDHLLAQTRRELKGAALLGLPETASVGVLKQPEVSQAVPAEIPHLVHLLAALAALKLKEMQIIQAAGAEGGVVYGYGYDPGQERNQVLADMWEGGVSLAQRIQRAKETRLRLSHVLSEQFTTETKKWAEGALFGGSGETVPKAFRETLYDHIKGKAGKEKVLREQLRAAVWAEFERSKGLYDFALQYLEHPDVLGPQPDGATVAAARDYVPAMKELRDVLWKKQSPAGEAAAGQAWTIASCFVEQLVR